MLHIQASVYRSQSTVMLMSQGSATSNANLITISAYGVAPTVQPLPPMHYQRAFHNSVILPTGKVLIMGGQVRNLVSVTLLALQTRVRMAQQHVMSPSQMC